MFLPPVASPGGSGADDGRGCRSRRSMTRDPSHRPRNVPPRLGPGRDRQDCTATRARRHEHRPEGQPAGSATRKPPRPATSPLPGLTIWIPERVQQGDTPLPGHRQAGAVVRPPLDPQQIAGPPEDPADVGRPVWTSAKTRATSARDRNSATLLAPARVEKLAYSMDSKSIARKGLRVRVPPRAPLHERT